eukprot:TRINITY_DN13126_c0_g1_i2.p1 TRINITY_DN13126_c0_g1~~TRINITY_DN13126_c0_g1_i2.p1  ORF type:complete len:181 (-),score=46.25 TRINITY_DN13126_c0_g1_i2:102-644(-)
MEENGELKRQYDELKSAKAKCDFRIEQLEAELAEAKAKLQQSQEVSGQLEERNSKLMKALNEDINTRAKKCKVLSKPNLKENIAELNEKQERNNKFQFSFGKDSFKGNTPSPLKKLVTKEDLSGVNNHKAPKAILQVIEYDTSFDKECKDECVVNKSGIAAKLQDFEQKLRKSLSKGNKI